MTLIDNDSFICELSKMFNKSKLSGTKVVRISLKHYDGQTKPIPKSNKSSPTLKNEDLCLFRAKLGSTKISTVVHAKEVNKFHLAYAQVLKTNMDNLKKRDWRAADNKSKVSAHKAKKVL